MNHLNSTKTTNYVSNVVLARYVRFQHCMIIASQQMNQLSNTKFFQVKVGRHNKDTLHIEISRHNKVIRLLYHNKKPQSS
jgi:hypothetical protein